VSSSLGWNALGDLLPVVKGLFVGSLITVLASIGLSNQQSTALHRLSSNIDGLDKLCNSLGQRVRGKWRPRKLQVLIWQVPSLLLVVSIFLFGLGLNLQVWITFAKSRKDLVVRYRLVVVSK
jgi:hypothetical protein